MPLLRRRTELSKGSVSSVSEGLNGLSIDGGIRLNVVVDGVGESGVLGLNGLSSESFEALVVGKVDDVINVDVLEESDPLGTRVVAVLDISDLFE